jgi:hypothetical protein
VVVPVLAAAAGAASAAFPATIIACS